MVNKTTLYCFIFCFIPSQPVNSVGIINDHRLNAELFKICLVVKHRSHLEFLAALTNTFVAVWNPQLTVCSSTWRVRYNLSLYVTYRTYLFINFYFKCASVFDALQTIKVTSPKTHYYVYYCHEPHFTSSLWLLWCQCNRPLCSAMPLNRTCTVQLAYVSNFMPVKTRMKNHCWEVAKPKHHNHKI